MSGMEKMASTHNYLVSHLISLIALLSCFFFKSN